MFVKTLMQKLTTVLTVVALAVAAALTSAAGDKLQTFTGEVSDSMCGAKHMMAGKAECTRACVGKGSKYALVSGDKVYTLDSSNDAVLDKLKSLAGGKATVTGTTAGDNITVSKVEVAK